MVFSMIRLAHLALLVSLSMLAAQVQPGVAGYRKRMPDLGWLPANTETLVVASQAFTIPEFGEEGHNVQQLASPLAILQHLPLGPLTQFPEVYGALVGPGPAGLYGHLRVLADVGHVAGPGKVRHGFRWPIG